LTLPPWAGSLLFVVVFGFVVYLGTRTVDLCNRVLMFAKIIAYVGLISIGMTFVKPVFLEHIDLKYVTFSLPILVISFGFHNMIPTLSDYLGGDVKRIRRAIISGALFSLVIYLFWQVVALGVLPLEAINTSYAEGQDAAVAINQILRSDWVRSFSTFLAFFAILTSFLAQSLSLVHFLADGMGVQEGKREPLGLCLLALLPPLLFAVLYPQIFYQALNFAGGICAVLLFGIFPVLMVWIGRKQEQQAIYRVRGGNVALLLIFFFASLIFVNQVIQSL
jgi:tyrosine-specific transport protein